MLKNCTNIFLTLSFLTLGPFTSAYAETLITEPLEKNIASQKKQSKPIGTAVSGAGNVTPIHKLAEAPQTMSCWQYGKLILEQSVIAPRDKVTDVRLLHHPDTGVEMLAFDFHNAFCFVK